MEDSHGLILKFHTMIYPFNTPSTLGPGNSAEEYHTFNMRVEGSTPSRGIQFDILIRKVVN